MRLTAKIMFVLLATVVLFTAVSSYISVQSAYSEFEAKQQQLVSQMGQQLHQRAAQEGRAGVNRLIESLTQSSTARHAGSLDMVRAERDSRANTAQRRWSSLVNRVG